MEVNTLNRKSLGVIIIIIGILAGLLFLTAGIQMNQTADNMKRLRSQAGTSLAEYYYQEVGGLTNGLSFLSFGLGLSVISLSIGIGAKFIIDENTQYGEYFQNENLLNKVKYGQLQNQQEENIVIKKEELP